MNLQSTCNLTEGKSFSGRRTFATEKSVLMSTLVRLVGSLRSNLDKKMIEKAVSDYGTLRNEFKDALFGILESYRRGEITAEVMEEMWRSEIKDAWGKAYEFGVRAVGNPFGVWEQDKTWLKGAEAEEFGYLDKFVEDIKKNELDMGIEDRLEMYSETLDGVFYHGKVDGSPEFVKIHWILNDAKHCNDCIRLAAGSPYNKKTLPAVPRDGRSRCLSNCLCDLRFEYGEEKPEPKTYVIKGPKAVVPPAGYRLPSDNERDKLGQMSSEIDRLRELIRATKGEHKKELIRMRRDINAELIDFMERHKIYYVPGGQVRKVKFVESIADEVRKELLLEGGAGSGYFGHKGRPGKRGGSLPGGVASAHLGKVTIEGDGLDKFNERRIMRVLAQVPQKHLEQSSLRVIDVLNGVEDVTEEWEDITGNKIASNERIDGFFEYSTGKMYISRGATPHVILHEFAHSLVDSQAKLKGRVWRGNASTGKITEYGKTAPGEAWAEGYAMFITDKAMIKRKSRVIHDIYEKAFK